MPKQPRRGTGHLRSGQRDLGVTQYEIHVGLLNKRETVVELESPPVAQNGEILELLLENGQVLRIQVTWSVPLLPRRRRASRTRAARGQRRERVVRHGPWATPFRHSERPGDSTSLSSLHGGRGACHPSRRDDDDIVLRGLPPRMGRTSAVVAAATRMDRRAIGRAESAERRSPDRLQAPTCTYCATDAYVRSIRRTSDEVYFACDGCEAMWALPRPRSNIPHRSLESR